MRSYARATRPLEKVVQAQGCTLIRSLSGKAYVLGHNRPRGDRPSTMQTPGLADIWWKLPAPRFHVESPSAACHAPQVADFVWPWPKAPGAGWYEVKRPGEKRRPEQVVFGEECQQAGIPYVWGDLDALFAYLVAGGWLVADSIAHYRQPAVPAQMSQGD